MGSTDLVIRAARPDDAAAIHELHTASVRRLCIDHYSADVIDGWLCNRDPSGYLSPIGRGDFFVAEQTGRIVGFGEAVPGAVIAVYVEPSSVRRGIGTALLLHALDMARSAAGGPIRLEATLNSRGFYERAGFREVTRSTVKRNEVNVPVVIMERDDG